MSSQIDQSSSLVIVGGGTWGLSTAYSLARAGYRNITVLEKDDQIPSRFSAGFDMNKIIRAEYADPFYTRLSLEAIGKWQTDPLYKPHFRQVGFLNAVSGTAPQSSKDTLQRYLESLQRRHDFDGKVVRVADPASIKEKVPAYNGELPGWHGYLNLLAGYAHSANAMAAVYKACLELGVNFLIGQTRGQVTELVHTSSRCTGVTTADSKFHQADRVVVACGAAIVKLLPQLGRQVKARCWGVAHIQLSQEEADQIRGIPVTLARDIGFLFEPDLETNKLKICNMGAGYLNILGGSDGFSLPLPRLQDSEYILEEDVKQMRRLLREVFPEFADRPLIDAHLCWFADTDDSDYIIDFAPKTGSSLAVLTGDSGHGFKFLPTIGDWARTLLETGQQTTSKWRWKEVSVDTTSSKEIGWRTGNTVELSMAARARL